MTSTDASATGIRVRSPTVHRIELPPRAASAIASFALSIPIVTPRPSALVNVPSPQPASSSTSASDGIAAEIARITPS